MNKRMFQISPSGQLVQVDVTESVVVNPDQILNVLKEGANTPENPELLHTTSELDCYYNLGDGVSVFQREFGGQTKTYGAIMLQQIPFYTRWALAEEGDVHMVIPNDGEEALIEIGAPLIMPIPEDLIIHFVVAWTHGKEINIMKPDPGIVYQLPELLRQNVSNCYLTAFSRSRNTCVRLPLPNLYNDARLCTGSSFDNDEFRRKINHWGITTSIKTYAKCWSDSGWNLDLLDGRGSRLMNQYRRFVRFNADTVEFMPFNGCADWSMSTSPVPLEELYKPWMSNEKPTMPEIMEGEEHLPEGDEGQIVDQPVEAVRMEDIPVETPAPEARPVMAGVPPEAFIAPEDWMDDDE